MISLDTTDIIVCSLSTGINVATFILAWSTLFLRLRPPATAPEKAYGLNSLRNLTGWARGPSPYAWPCFRTSSPSSCTADPSCTNQRILYCWSLRSFLSHSSLFGRVVGRDLHYLLYCQTASGVAPSSPWCVSRCFWCGAGVELAGSMPTDVCDLTAARPSSAPAMFACCSCLFASLESQS